MDLEPDAVPEPEVEPVCQPFALGARALGRVAGVLDRPKAATSYRVAAGDPRVARRRGPPRAPRGRCRAARATSSRDRAVDERPRHVRPAAAGLVARPQVDLDRQVRRQRPGAGIVAAVAGQRGHDHDVPRSGSARRGAGLADRRPHRLRRQRLPSRSPSRAAPRISASPAGQAGLGRALGAPDALELSRVLHAPPRLHRVRVDRDADARGAQPIGDRHRQCRRARRPPSGPTARPRAPPSPDRRSSNDEPLLHQLVEAEVLGEQQLRRRAAPPGSASPSSELVRTQRPSVVGHEQERVDDRERHLVPQRRRADRVAVAAGSAHVSSRSSPRRTPVISATRRIASSVPAMYGSGVPPASW